MICGVRRVQSAVAIPAISQALPSAVQRQLNGDVAVVVSMIGTQRQVACRGTGAVFGQLPRGERLVPNIRHRECGTADRPDGHSLG